MHPEHQIGPHTLRIDGDTVSLCLSGEFQAEHIARVISLIDEIGGGQGPFYVLADVERLNGMPAEARRIAGAWKGIGRAGGTAIIGATMLQRTLVTLVSRASTMLSNTRKNGEVSFFKTEEEARAWLATRRVAASSRSLRG